ncbi:hypothetical protein PbJCM13498_38400 [Prolixibacter bellariivorans]|uniref:Uncharacterized protein n=1 Tax=Prolixibacter bellariivorans TaxID=314319 RepID=A0A5M4B5I8_9BACT|nr:hypothetical protein [Prolixibacter bellariivorans]GET34977.1 hypothetical protein PbJCM13498_38400 [Prolixibacter bellariivorans]
MKTYLPYYFRRIGIAFVFVAVVLSTIANIDAAVSGFQRGYRNGHNVLEHSYVEGKSANHQIISAELKKTLTWVSLSFSFAGFLLYMFSKEKVEDEFIERLRYMSLAKSLLITWLITSALLIIHGELQLEGFYILQFQLFLYVVIYNYYKKWKFMVA